MYFLRLCILLLLLLPCSGLATENGGGRDVTILGKQGSLQIPRWKTTWDQARKLAAEERYDQAVLMYEKLFQEKPQLEAAQFEYARLLKVLGRCNDTVTILENLIQYSPDHLEYYLLLANCLDILKLFEKAATTYGTLYYKDPYGKYSTLALEGLITNLKKQGKINTLFPLLHQLILRKPDSFASLYQFAHYLYEVGRVEEAVEKYSMLLNRFTLTDEILVEIEQVFEKAQVFEELLKVRLFYLTHNPNDVIRREKVAKYYLETRRFDEALEQYEILTRQGADVDAELLLKVANIYYSTTRRMDKALQAFELYLSYDPFNQAVKEKIRNIQRMLAGDFAVIVQNDGAALLWKDLEKLTASRSTIFLLMADTFKAEGNEERYQEILELLYQENAEDQNISTLLAKQLVLKKQYQKALQLLEKTKADMTKGKDYWLILKEILLNLDDVHRAYDLAVSCLENGNSSSELFPVAFKLSLVVQDFNRAEQYFHRIQNDNKFGEVDVETWTTFIEYLYIKGDFTLSGQLVAELLQIFSKDPAKQLQLQALQIKALTLKGQIYSAEQQYRALIIKKPHQDVSYLALFRFMVETGRIKEIGKWLESIDGSGIINFVENRERAAMFSRFLVERDIALGRYNRALSTVKKELRNNEHEPQGAYQYALHKLAARIYFLKKEYRRFSNEILLLLKNNREDVFLLTSAVYLIDKKLPGYKSIEQWYNRQKELPLISSLLTYVELGLYQEFLQQAEKAEQTPSALYFQLARSYEMMNKYDNAILYYQKLCDLYPAEPFYKRKIVELHFKVGKFEMVLEELAELRKQPSTGNDFQDFNLSMLEARTLWAMDQHQESIETYSRLLASQPLKALTDKNNIQTVLQACFPDEKDLEDISLGEDDLEELMEMVFQPEWILQNIERKMVEEVNTFFSDYRRQQMVKKELAARQAILDRDYFYAEMQVEKLLRENDQQITEEQLLDLADIYNRLGKHMQEAEVYEKLADTYQDSPQLLSRIEKNRQLLKPLNSVFFGYRSEKGRLGLKDTKNTQFGVTGKVPSLINHLFAVGYNYQLYSASSTDAEANLHQLYGEYTINFLDDYLISTRLGSVKRESGDSTLVYDVKIEGQVDQYFKTYARVSQTLMIDTLESIKENIYKRDYEIGFVVDSIPRVVLGGNGKYRQISDDNRQQLVNLYASFNVFREKWHFQAKYAVDAFLSENEDGGLVQSDPLSYWSPDSFWRHQLIFYVDVLLSENRSFGGAPGHISLQYGVGYEDNRSVVHSGAADIFLEINNNFLLKGSLSFLDTEDYTMREGMLSLVVRW